MKKSNEPNPLPHINKISWQKWLYPHEVEQINQFYNNLKKEINLIVNMISLLINFVSFA